MTFESVIWVTSISDQALSTLFSFYPKPGQEGYGNGFLYKPCGIFCSLYINPGEFHIIYTVQEHDGVIETY